MRDPGLSRQDVEVVSAQLGRWPRDLVNVAHRCPCGNPDVVTTRPRLGDGTPFPTLYYLTCPRASAEVSALEASGLMAAMEVDVQQRGDLAARYRAAHESYLAERARLGDVPEIAEVSAGGMPHRVKCLHALVAHSLAVGPGTNPVGDAVLTRLPRWWRSGPCVDRSAGTVEDR